MIGDWVSLPAMQTNAQVTAIGEQQDGRCLLSLTNGKFRYHSINVETVQPIPLTPDILTANGFRAIKRDGSLTVYTYEDNSNTLSIRLISTVYQWGNVQIDHVHQLQHILNLLDKSLSLPAQDDNN